MFPIDKRAIKREVDRLGSPRKKEEKGLNVTLVAESYKKTVWNLMDTLQDIDAYTMYHWLLHMERWIKDSRRDLKTPYQRGEIVYVELGAMNFGYEASYEHPAIVMANSHNMVLVAPCSSQKFGKGHKDGIDIPVTEATGLTRNTGVSLSNIKWISKNRIVDRAGVVTNIVKLDQIDDYLMKQLYYSRVLDAHHDNEIFDLTREQIEQEKEIEALKSVLSSIEDMLTRHSPDLLDSFRDIAATKK